jgi:hypothetical protein
MRERGGGMREEKNERVGRERKMREIGDRKRWVGEREKGARLRVCVRERSEKEERERERERERREREKCERREREKREREREV